MRPLNYIEKFFVYGFSGLCVELLFTGVYSVIYNNDLTLKGYTYIWMIPVWATGFYSLEITGKYIRKDPLWNNHIILRGFIYMIICVAIEYLFGIFFLTTLGQIPWDYSYSEYSVHGAI